MKITPRENYYHGRLVEVYEGWMDGNAIALRKPILYSTGIHGHHVDTIRRKEFNNVSAPFKYLNTSHKYCNWLTNLVEEYQGIAVESGASCVIGTFSLCLGYQSKIDLMSPRALVQLFW